MKSGGRVGDSRNNKIVMRLFSARIGRSGSRGSVEALPSTSAILLADTPELLKTLRVAFARSELNSQLE